MASRVSRDFLRNAFRMSSGAAESRRLDAALSTA